MVARCKPTGAVKVSLETTREEIVAVYIGAAADPASVHSCIEAGLWDLALSIPDAPWTAMTTMTFDAP